MTTTTQIASIREILDLTAIYNGYEDDYNAAGVLNDYLKALQAAAQAIAPSVTIHLNGLVIASIEDADAAREIDFRELADSIDITPILAAHEIQVIDRDDIIKALRAADIEFTVEHSRTINESFVVTNVDGRQVAFGVSDAFSGIALAYYEADLNSDATWSN